MRFTPSVITLCICTCSQSKQPGLKGQGLLRGTTAPPAGFRVSGYSKKTVWRWRAECGSAERALHRRVGRGPGRHTLTRPGSVAQPGPGWPRRGQLKLRYHHARLLGSDRLLSNMSHRVCLETCQNHLMPSAVASPSPVVVTMATWQRKFLVPFGGCF